MNSFKIFLSILFTLIVTIIQGQTILKPEPKLTLYYDLNEFELKSTHIDSLDSKLLAEAYNKYIIVGYADSTGKPEKNLTLSEKRGQGVIEYLQNKGFDNDKLSLIIKGSDSSGGKELSKNRRVVILVEKIKNLNPKVVKGKKGSKLYLEDSLDVSVEEYFTPEDLVKNNITTISSSGEQLISGGMFALDFQNDEDTSKFNDMEVTFCMPIGAYQDQITKSNEVDYSAMTLWASEIGEDGKVKWVDTGIPFEIKEETNEICITTKGDSLFSGGRVANADIPCDDEDRCPDRSLSLIIKNPYKGVLKDQLFFFKDSTNMNLNQIGGIITNESSDTIVLAVDLYRRDSLTDFYVQINGINDNTSYSYTYSLTDFEKITKPIKFRTTTISEGYFYEMILHEEEKKEELIAEDNLSWWKKFLENIFRKPKTN